MGNFVRGVRGAITVENNTAEEITKATQELLTDIINHNDIKLEDIASILFTTTSDLNAVYPAFAARQMGWRQVPMLGTVEMAVPRGLEKCIRVLMHINTYKSQSEIIHIYLRKAEQLRRDLEK